MSDDSPTLGEVVRRLDEVSRRLDEVSNRLDQREARMAAEYLRKDVADEREQATAYQLRGIEGEVHSLGKRMDTNEDRRRQDRALVVGSLAFPLLVALLAALLLSGSV